MARILLALEFRSFHSHRSCENLPNTTLWPPLESRHAQVGRVVVELEGPGAESTSQRSKIRITFPRSVRGGQNRLGLQFPVSSEFETQIPDSTNWIQPTFVGIWEFQSHGISRGVQDNNSEIPGILIPVRTCTDLERKLPPFEEFTATGLNRPPPDLRHDLPIPGVHTSSHTDAAR